ncbi:translation initiation factor IF-2-like isoform X2 [Lutra lutra]|uniref:translation initiation factor IF-2-like isoform X2 n=1 Tax=Lutra lutra TaxID=9657 RepID=UPI001FD26085|nr:translation initiation factor IF-2-like isoform X2 [Lutra lutra]
MPAAWWGQGTPLPLSLCGGPRPQPLPHPGGPKVTAAGGIADAQKTCPQPAPAHKQAPPRDPHPTAVAGGPSPGAHRSPARAAQPRPARASPFCAPPPPPARPRERGPAAEGWGRGRRPGGRASLPRAEVSARGTGGAGAGGFISPGGGPPIDGARAVHCALRYGNAVPAGEGRGGAGVRGTQGCEGRRDARDAGMRGTQGCEGRRDTGPAGARGRHRDAREGAARDRAAKARTPGAPEGCRMCPIDPQRGCLQGPGILASQPPGCPQAHLDSESECGITRTTRQRRGKSPNQYVVLETKSYCLLPGAGVVTVNACWVWPNFLRRPLIRVPTTTCGLTVTRAAGKPSPALPASGQFSTVFAVRLRSVELFLCFYAK